ncbi:hypothetical protein [Galenea microaerophila]
MKNVINLLIVLTITVIIPLAVILGIWAGYLPEVLEVYIAQFAVAAAIFIIVGGNLFLIYSDIKTGRYKKQ